MEDGDDGFDAFVQKTSGRMMTAARLLVGSRDQAEDLVQEAYVRTYAHWAQVADGQPYAYARRIMLNRYLDWWRRPWREHACADFDDIADGALPADTIATVDQIRRGLGELTRRERTVIVMRYFENASEAEIAETLGLAPGTVKSTANRAMGKLRRSPHFDRLWEGDSRG